MMSVWVFAVILQSVSLVGPFETNGQCEEIRSQTLKADIRLTTVRCFRIMMVRK